MQRKGSTLTPIKSRENLLIESTETTYQHKRTKIMCSINHQTCELEIIRNMITAGANALSINTAYTKDRKVFEKLKQIRDQLEVELERTIPLNMMLQGKIVRVGQLRNPELFLKKGQRLRLTQDWKVHGDHNIVSVDQGEFFTKARVGDHLSIDYGQINLKLLMMETDEEAKLELMDQYPDLYSSELSFRQAKPDDKLRKASGSMNSQQSIDSPQSFSSQSSKKQRYIEKLNDYKKYKSNWKQYQCFVCEVQDDCILRPYKPVFLIQCESNVSSASYYETEPDEVESQITSKDINDFSMAKKLDYDVITLSNVQSAEEVKELRYLMGQNSHHIQIYVRITTKTGVDNFEKIMAEADGCIIARAYICINFPVEDFVQEQHEMIKKCRKMLKPVYISTQILESMLTRANPTFTEMGDIANAVEEHIDGIMLSGETTYGNYPIKVVESLARVCKNIETQCLKIRKFIGEFDQHPDSKPIISVISQSAVETAHLLHAKMILLFTSTNLTALTISKLETSCCVVAVTAKQHIARWLNLVSGITPMLIGSLYGADLLTNRILNQLVEKEWLEKGDFVIVITGLFGAQEGCLNQLKILQI